ncbi:hypothetical protein RclHR1_10470009 [Rhizophagus clarus]|nr:hypothetical protein RclHR1_10470009 [Rhizophagus clarus]
MSSGRPPFHEEKNKIGLISEIPHGRRETIVPDTPNGYSNLYTKCWNYEQSERPSMKEVVDELRIFISNSNSTTNYQQNDSILDQINPISNEDPTPSSTGSSLHKELSQMVQHLINMNTNELLVDNIISTNRQPNENVSLERNLSIMIIEIVDLIFKKANKTIEEAKQDIFDYFNVHDVNSNEIYNWLLDNQNNPDSLFLLGYFNYVGIGTIKKNYRRAFNLFTKASKQDHILAEHFVGECYRVGIGITKDEQLAFKYYENIANKGYAMGQFKLGWLYKNGINVKKDLKIAAYWYEKAANNGHLGAMNNLGLIYKNGDESVNHQKAFELFKKSAEGGLLDGTIMLGRCYNAGIGVNIDKKKAVELYKKAANLEHEVAQYNLALLYEKEKDLNKAIYWYEESAKRGYQNAQNKLRELREKKIRNNLCIIS